MAENKVSLVELMNLVACLYRHLELQYKARVNIRAVVQLFPVIVKMVIILQVQVVLPHAGNNDATPFCL